MHPLRSAPLFTAMLLGAVVPLTSCAGSGPEQLAQAVQTAFEAGDIDAALALAKLDQAPADLHVMYQEQVGECASASTLCSASLAPVDAEYQAELAQQAEQQGLEIGTAPAGLVVVKTTRADSEREGSLRMPYAEVDGKFVLVTPRLGAAKLEELRTTSNDALLLRVLDKGIYDAATGERDKAWKDGATALPADGGEPGAALRQRAQTLAAAAAAQDPDAAMKADSWAEQVFSATDWNQKPIDKATRQRTLRAQAARFLHDVKIAGGWQKGDHALVLAEAKNGIGWTERGVWQLKRENGAWSVAGDTTVSYPTP